MMRAPLTGRRLVTWGVVLLASACGVALDQRYSSGGNTLDLSLVPAERFNLIRAVDVLVFDKDVVDCATLVGAAPATVAGEAWSGRLSDNPIRRPPPAPLSKAHARICDVAVPDPNGGPGLVLKDDFRFVLGKVCAKESAEGGCAANSRGTKSILVTASHLNTPCDDNNQDELIQPGVVVAAGCEEVEVVSGKETSLELVLLPWRDAP